MASPHAVPFHVPSIGEEEIRAVVDTLRSGWLTTGPRAHEFERQFAAAVQSAHAVAVNSCTAALHLALEAIGLEAGDEVIVPTMTFAATAEVVTYFKATPVLVDCRADTLNIDADLVERAITPRTRAVIPVHFAGQPCDLEPILAVSRRHGLKVIEDAAHAFPARYRGAMIGSVGDITCFSFYATKNLTTGEGGMATTEDPDWAARMRMMSLHGMSRDAWKRYSAEGTWFYELLGAGFKYNMTDIAAALGIEQLRKSDALLDARTRCAAMYQEALRSLPEITTPAVADDVQHAWHLYVIQLNLDRLRIGRSEFIERLTERGIGTSVHFIPLHLQPFYRDTWKYRPQDFPIASAVYERIVSLPLYPSMTERDVRTVVAAITALVEECRR